MRRIRLPILSLRYYWRSNLAVLLGMAVGTAVLTGALIVGDSIRGSLRQMTLERLGKVDYALTSPGFFRQALAEDLARSEGFGRNFSSAQTAILLRGSIENAETSAFSRGVQIIGVDQHFWELDSFSTQPPHIAGRRAAINSALAHAIGVKTGGSVLLRLDRPDAIPADAVAGRKSERIETLRLDVEQILRDRGFGRFGLFSGQQTPLNIFVPMETLQRQFKLVGKVNALLLVAKGEREEAGADQSSRLQSLIRQSAQIEDLGLRARANVSPSYVSVESARMVLNDAEIAAIQDSATTLGLEFAPTLTYLANLIQLGDKEIPYSTIAAINPAANAPLGPLRLVDDYAAEKLNPNEILINEWAAKELGAKKGDRLRFSYFVDGPRGQLKTVTSDDFIVTGTVAMAGPANDPGLTPEYPGINDAKNMRDWNPPFPVDLSKIRDADEAYWKDHKATPKAFIALETGLKMWSSRFGKLTSIRVASTGAEPAEYTAVRLAEEIRKRLEPKNAGLVFQPVKLRGLQASEGTSDFAQLFIGFSFFIIIAAMLLVRLFFSLGVERRAREIGILMAAGFTGGQVRRLMMFEGAILAFIGGAAGVWIGKGYAWLMLYGLRTWWIGAVGTTFLELHADPLSLKIGFGAGVAVGLLSVFFAARGFTRADPAKLLAGGASGFLPAISSFAGRGGMIQLLFGSLLLLGAAGSAVAAFRAGAEEQEALFYAAGSLALAGSLILVSAAMRRGPLRGVGAGGFFPLLRLGAGNAARHRSRSVMTIALVASAVFIIVAVAANRHGGAEGMIEKKSGNGGFALIAESDAPIYYDLNTEAGRGELGFQPADEAILSGARIYSLHLSPGEDASCLNLYKPVQPRILGAPPELIERGGFAFQSSLADSDDQKQNPWKLLDADSPDGAIPAIADLNTAMWILHSGLGQMIPIQDSEGHEVKLKLSALLQGSALQGELIVSEKNFTRLFPDRAGSQFFLAEASPSKSSQVQSLLESSLRDYGFDAQPTQERIESFLAVENTYLSTFQALGGLGLLLGTLGLAAVMLRNIIERRSELALLRAFGYRSSALAVLVMAENAFLLVAGLLIGTGSAFLAVAPRINSEAAAIPWSSLSVTLAAVAVTGFAAGIVAVSAALRSPILEALRSP